MAVARSIRIEYPGAFYHVMARGNRREAIFRSDPDRQLFLETLNDACTMTGWRVHAWVLMRNHYHLFVETPEANLVAGMQWLQNAFTRRFNARHRVWGRLFGDRYKAVVVEGKGRYYYETLLDYIHLNPVRAKLVQPRRGQSLLDYKFSSVAAGHALAKSKRPSWLASEAVLEAFGCKDSARGRRKWVERLDRRAVEEDATKCGLVTAPQEMDARCSHLRRGWYWGSEAFGERVLKLAEPALRRDRNRNYRASLERQAHDATRAEQLLAQGLHAARLRPQQLQRLSGADARKVAIARAIWQHTVVSQKWIADRLCMKSAANVSQQLRRYELGSKRKTQHGPAALQTWIRTVKI
jgi:REP element-mobilizing transposase RayT